MRGTLVNPRSSRGLPQRELRGGTRVSSECRVMKRVYTKSGGRSGKGYARVQGIFGYTVLNKMCDHDSNALNRASVSQPTATELHIG
jgi:hypothetical protein